MMDAPFPSPQTVCDSMLQNPSFQLILKLKKNLENILLEKKETMIIY